jgi:hypothetical protein
MAKSIKQYEQELLNVIKEYNIFFIEEIFAYTSVISRGHFYELNLNKSDTLLKAMTDNKTKTKKSMQNKWYKSDNATLQVALMKLICDDDERQKLSQSYNKIDADIKGQIDTGTKEVANLLRSIIESNEEEN